jgi:poly(ribitol-phosphate) beta-N-acetylglucosaminyltransferase
MRPLVSVVIPAHNLGRYIEPCIRSIVRQSLPRDQFEVVFVDDGSTDGTGERLARLARQRPNVRVIRIPASGGPGRPRNVGLEAALGDYVQFLDGDDELAPTALRRLLRMAHANGSDIVVGKFASETMSRRQDLFNRNRPATTFAATPQLAEASMGPTKLFRTAFLRENEISFPEGWRQMEDQLFTLRAYLAARVISILGDEPCYFFNKRGDEGHISAELVDVGSHVAHLGEILDEIHRGVTDLALQRRLISRFYRAEVLARLAGPQFLSASPDYQRQLFTGLQTLALERFAEVGQDLGAIARIRSRLLHEGRLEEIILLGRRMGSYMVDARVTHAAWVNGRLGLEFRGRLWSDTDGKPLTLVPRDHAVFLDPAIADDLVGPVDVTAELAAIKVQVSLVDRQTALEWIVSGTGVVSTRRGGVPGKEVSLPSLVGFVMLDPKRVGPGGRRLEDGAWDVLLRWSGLGLSATGLLRVARRERTAKRPVIAPALIGSPVGWVVPGIDGDGVLRFRVGGADRAPARIDTTAGRVLRQGRSLAVELPIATDRFGTVAFGTLRLSGDGATFDLPATFSGSLGTLVVATSSGVGQALPGGRYTLTAHVGTANSPGLPVGSVLVRDDGRLMMRGLQVVSPLERARSVASWSARAGAETVRWRAFATARRLPGWAKHLIRSSIRRTRG